MIFDRETKPAVSVGVYAVCPYVFRGVFGIDAKFEHFVAPGNFARVLAAGHANFASIRCVAKNQVERFLEIEEYNGTIN